MGQPLHEFVETIVLHVIEFKSVSPHHGLHLQLLFEPEIHKLSSHGLGFRAWTMRLCNVLPESTCELM